MFALYLMTQKGRDVLEALIQHGHAKEIDRVIGARDAQVHADYFDDIRGLCARAGIAFAERNEASALPSAWNLAVSWRWLLQVGNLVVLHDSLLPRYRGFAPLVSALINGEPQVGVTALLAAAEFDAGDIVGQKSLPIDYPAKIGDVIARIAGLYSELALDVVAQVRTTGSVKVAPQDHSRATYSLWRDDEDYSVDWTDSAERIERFVNAVGFPYKGAAASIDGKSCRIWDAEAMPDVAIENRTAGKVLFVQNGCPLVVCGGGLLKVTRMTNDAGDSMLPLHALRVRFR